MHRNIFVLIYSILLLSIVGCALQLQTPYSPSILLNGKGSLYIDKFHYLPSERLENPLAKNQIDTFSGLNSIYTEENISEVVKKALLKELKFIGYSIESSSNILIGGDILEFSCDYIGLANVDFKSQIKFKIYKINNNICEEIYSKVHEGKVRADKSLGGPELIYGSLSKAIESFLTEAKGMGLL